MHRTLGKVVREGPATGMPDREVELDHRGLLQAVGLELERSIEWPLLDHGRIHALSLAAARVLDRLQRVWEDHQAQVGQATCREGRRHKGTPHGGVELSAKVLDIPFNSRAWSSAHFRLTDADARGGLVHSRRQRSSCYLLRQPQEPLQTRRRKRSPRRRVVQLDVRRQRRRLRQCQSGRRQQAEGLLGLHRLAQCTGHRELGAGRRRRLGHLTSRVCQELLPWHWHHGFRSEWHSQRRWQG
mmetsp:Transcript_41567/g.115648  ORF Transcript_41567/g.115648 Transcript_41567/m.115648 type:complete len:242 (-) Transcript_41567:464-1189(-)